MTQLRYELPGWLPGDIAIPDLDGQLRFAVELSRLSVAHGGGPFGAAIFDAQGALLGRGVNLVLAAECSLLHAEVVAIHDAQQRLGTWDLGVLAAPEAAAPHRARARDGERPAKGRAGARIVTSCQPCVMCFGAILWSGVCELAYAATAEDACAIGFDEGPLVPDWAEQLARRGIRVQAAAPELRAEAVAVLQAYAAAGHDVYNPTRR